MDNRGEMYYNEIGDQRASDPVKRQKTASGRLFGKEGPADGHFQKDMELA